MENIIIFGIIIVSIIINIIKNYQKESKKNSERVIGKPSQQINKPISSEDTPYSFNTPETYDSLEYNFQTVESQSLTTSDYISKYNVEMDTMAEDTSDEDTGSSANTIFKTSDDLKLAVLYSTILERKF